jgi:2-oxoglutarate ferredoxin oxidoreductase subunit gamma
MRREIQLAGFGGQGIILAGHILGKAVSLYDGKDAALTQSYGPEARGGACAAELVISDEPIDYPMVSQPEIVVCMSQEAFKKYGVAAAQGAQLIVDSDLVEGAADMEWLRHVPFTRLADDLGRRIVANVVMLGSFTAITALVSREAMEEAVRTTVRERVVDLNMRAFEAGYDYAAKTEVAP